jgi:hypothetical protein
MLDRVSRNIDAAKYHPSAIDGITRWSGVPDPEAGSQRSCTPWNGAMTQNSSKEEL